MIEVMPLKFGPIFKRVFSKPKVFCQFAKDVLGIDIGVEQVQTEYEYPKPIGFVRSKYDLFAEDTKNRIIVEIQHVKEEDFFDRFLYYHLISLVEQVGGFKEYCFDNAVYTIVILTSVPKDGSVDFSYAVSDFNPLDEHGRVASIYPHRLVFLVPRLANDKTPPNIRKWLAFIEDSLDGKMDEISYPEDPFHSMLNDMRSVTVSPEELAMIKDEAAWEKAKARFIIEAQAVGHADGRAEGHAEGHAEGRAEGVNEGHAKGQAELISNMLTRGKSIQQVMELTGLDEAQITALQHSNNHNAAT